MFLNKIIERNPEFIEACVDLHQQGLIPANSYVLDLDTLGKNAKFIAEEADKYGLKVLAMSKQIGRNPEALKTIKANGIDSCVCVDMNDARPVHATGLKIGHLGHLVQVPQFETKAGLNMEPEYWTVFNLDKARVISENNKTGRVQNIMLRIWEEGDTFYTGHEGGFSVKDLPQAIKEINNMEGLRFAGLTTFPTQLFNHETKQVEHTQNYYTLLKATAEIEDMLGHKIEVNAPGTTSSMLFEEMASNGVTQVEPGHGLTGGCPQHAYHNLQELPALAYVSEISHFHRDRGYCFGGGMYIDPVFGDYDVKACVGKTYQQALNNKFRCNMPKPEAIDYYGIFDPQPEGSMEIGDTVVFGFRAQVFVTRAFVVPVEGIHSGNPKVKGIYNSEGRMVGWPEW